MVPKSMQTLLAIINRTHAMRRIKFYLRSSAIYRDTIISRARSIINNNNI